MKFLPHAGILFGLALVWYGRKTSSDLRIIGYIIIAPSLFGLIKTSSGVDLSGKIAGGAPASGDALPSRDSVASQDAMYPSILTSTFQPPGTASVRFGSTTGGGSKVTPNDGGVTLSPPGSFGGVKRRY